MADYDKVIPPGQEGKIDVKITGKKIHSTGRFTKRFTVTTNDPEKKKVILSVSGTVTKVFDVSRRLALTGFVDDDMQMETILTNRLETPILITGSRWNEKNRDAGNMKDKLGVKVTELERGKKYSLKVWKKDQIPPGFYYSDLILTTDFEHLREKKLIVRLTVTPDVEVHPSTIYLPQMRVPEGTSKSFDKTFRVIAARGDSLKVLDVTPDRGDVTVNLREVQPGRVYAGTVRIRPPSTMARYMATLTIRTNYPGFEKIELPISGTVRTIKTREEKK